MSIAFDRISETPTLDGLPIRMEQTSAPATTIARLLLLSPALVLLAVPLLVGAHVAGEPVALAAVAGQPVAAIQVLVGFLLWAGLLAIPLGQAIRRMGARRSVEIDRREVRVVDQGLVGGRRWSEPLAAYRGIAHHVRTSMSGVRHELVLVHADPSRNVLLAFHNRISLDTLEKAKALLGLPEVPARAIYERSATVDRPVLSVAAGLAEAR